MLKINFLVFFQTREPFSMAAGKAIDAIGKALELQYARWQPRVGFPMFQYTDKY